MSTITLDGISLPEDLQWTDEFTAWKVGQAVKYSLTGALIVHESAMQAGRPITLETQQDGARWVAPVSLEILNLLRASEEEAHAAPFEIVLPAHNTGTRTFNVIWRRNDGAAIEARPLRFAVPSRNADLFAVTLRLMTVD